MAESELDGPGASAGVPEHGGAIDAESDRYLPQYDVTETHAVVVDADTDLIWQAVRRSDLSQSAVIRVLLEMRCLPNRLQWLLKRRPSEPSRPPLTLDDMQRAGFLLLGEWPGHEIVFGTVGTRLRTPGRRLRMERRQNSRAAWSKRQSPPCNRVPPLQRGPGVIEVIKGTATARSGQLTMPCPVCAQRRYDDVIGNFRA